MQKAAQEDNRSVQLHSLKTITGARHSLGRATLVITSVPTALGDWNREFTSCDCSKKTSNIDVSSPMPAGKSSQWLGHLRWRPSAA